MASDSDDGEENVCPICHRTFETMAGIRLHWTRGHTMNEIDTAINESLTQHLPNIPPPPDVNTQTQSRSTVSSAASSSAQSATELLANRITCNDCGFVAKNERGLNVHLRSHNNQETVGDPQHLPAQFDFDPNSTADIIQRFGELIYKCKCSVPLVRIIQKSVRTVVCQELTKAVEYVVEKNDLFAWCRLMSFPIIVLNTIPKSSFKDNHRPNIIRHNLKIYSKLNDVASIFNELLNLWSYDRPKRPLSNSEKLIIKIAQRKISEGDISGAVRVLSSDDRIADHTQENIDKLEHKHPDENSDLDKENIQNLEPFDTSTEQIVNAIKHFPISSSGGIDGMRPRHLKDLISFSCGDASRMLTSAIAKLINIIRSGEIFADIEHIFYGASLIALAKDNGDIRPIAIGLVWRRLAGKIGCFAVKDSVSQLLAPISNGFGVQGGSEAIVHAVRAYAKANHAAPTAIIKFDFSNAFNEIFRNFLLNEIKTTAPSLFPMLKQAYRRPSSLFFGDAIILSKRGTQQGDPCAPAAFSIALRPLTHSLRSKLNSWFLDDGTIGDVFNVLLEDIRRVLAFSIESGLSLNPAKCEIYFINAPPEAKENMLDELNQLLPGIKVLDNSSFRLLGAPILEEGISESLSKGLDTVKTLCKRLPLLDIHPALTLLRSSLSSPRFQYLLRTAPTFSHVAELTEIDEFYRHTLEEITNNKLSDNSWIQGSLPMAYAGLGIRRTVDLAHPAYFSSVFQSEDLSNRILAQSKLTIINSDFDSSLQAYPVALIPPNVESKRIQSHWDNLRSKSTFDELLSSSGPTDRARLLSSSTQPSSKWLQAVPSQQLGLLLDNDSARVAVALRLGNNVCEPHRCICGEMVDPKGYHALSCNKTSGKYVCHSTINKTFSMAFSSAQVPNRLEPYGLSRRDGKRPDGITSYPWSKGRLLIWDVTIVNTMAGKYIRSSSLTSGAAADEAERNKHNLYIDLKEHYVFTPLAFEAFGAIGPETSIFLKKLGKLMKEHTGEKRSLDYLLQRISIAIQRSNAVSIRDSFGTNGGNDFNVFK